MGHRLSKNKTTRYARKILSGHSPFGPAPGYAYALDLPLLRRP